MPDKNSKFFNFKNQLFIFGFILALGTFVFYFTDLDFIISDPWFSIDHPRQWPQRDNPFWSFIYDYGSLPCILLGLFSILYVFWSFLVPEKEVGRWKAYCAILCILLGPGLVINGILKPNFGRPRPYHIKRYDSNQNYQKVLIPGKKGASFPSGHASAGFVMTILFYLNYRKHKKTACFFWVSGMSLGILLGITRIVQGGHFGSDILWSFGLTQLINSLIFFKLLNIPEKESRSFQKRFKYPSKKKKFAIMTLMLVITLTFIFRFALEGKIEDQKITVTKLSPDTQSITLVANLGTEDVKISRGGEGKINFRYRLRGFGLPWSDAIPIVTTREENNKLSYKIKIKRNGIFRKYSATIYLTIPKKLKLENKIKLNGGEIIYR